MGPARFHCATPLDIVMEQKINLKLNKMYYVVKNLFSLSHMALNIVAFICRHQVAFYSDVAIKRPFLELSSYLLRAGLPNTKQIAEEEYARRLASKNQILEEKRCEIFGDIYNPEKKRVGNRYLETPLIGNEQYSYGLTKLEELHVETKPLKDSCIMKIPEKKNISISTALDAFTQLDMTPRQLQTSSEQLLEASLDYVPVEAEKVVRKIRKLRREIRNAGKQKSSKKRK
jgi:hypothetical protein